MKERTLTYAARPSRKSRAPNALLFPQARHLTPQERRALKAFQDFLLAQFPNQIEWTMLYGSKARGDSTAESDIDVLVVVSDLSASKTWDVLSPNWSAISEYEFELSLKYAVGISSIIAYHDEAQKWSPLHAHIHAEGIELWRKPGIEFEPWPAGGQTAMALSKQEHIEARMTIAQEKIADARLLFDNERFNGVLSSAYYAMFYASKALLLALGEDPHKHEGVVSLFGERIAKIGLSAPKYGTVLRKAKELREDADYEDFFRATREQAEEAIQNADEFIQQAQATLKKIQTRGK